MSQLSRREIINRVASGGSLRAVNLVRADLSSAELAGADLCEANLRMAVLEKANLREAKLASCHLSGAILNQANLARANLVEANMIGAQLRDADMSQVDLSGAELTGSILTRARLSGAYLVGTFLTDAALDGADLTGAYVRMAQLGGSNLAGATLDGADFSHADLSGVRLDNASLVGTALAESNLSASWLIGCDLRNANLTGANLMGCNLTGAKLYGITFDGVCLDDAWAEWVDLSESGDRIHKALLEEVFVGIFGKPMAQVLVAGSVENHVWAQIVDHLCEFQELYADYRDVRLRAIHQGVSSSVLYLEAQSEFSLAAYLAEFADITGKGSIALFEKLGAVGSATETHAQPESTGPRNGGSAIAASDGQGPGTAATMYVDRAMKATTRMEALEGTEFWRSDKAFAILTSTRKIWFEASSSNSLTLRPPRGSVSGLDVVRGRFVATNFAPDPFPSQEPRSSKK